MKAFPFQYAQTFPMSTTSRKQGHQEEAPTPSRTCSCLALEYSKPLPVQGLQSQRKILEKPACIRRTCRPPGKSAPSMSIILGTILRDSFSGVKQSLKEGLNGMTKVRDWRVILLLLRLPMVHSWVISVERIVEYIPIGERIYEKKIVSKMAVFAETLRVRENSIQPLKIIVEFLSNRI